MYIAGMWGCVIISAIYFILSIICISKKSIVSKSVFFLILVFLLFMAGCYRMSDYSERFERYEAMSVGDYICISGEITDITKNSFDYVITIYEDEIYHYVYTDDVTGIEIGYKIRVEGTLMEMKIPRNPGNFNQKEYLNSLGVATRIRLEAVYICEHIENEIKVYIKRIKEALCDNIDSIASESEAGILKAMLFGEKKDMDKEDTKMYQKAGISHVLCISGLHISALGTSLFYVFRRRLSYYSSSVISIILMILFGILTGNGVSAKRAVIMFFVSLLAKVLGRKYDIQSSLMLAVMILLYSNPYYIFNTSFRLSVLAIVAIGFVYPIIWKGLDNVFKLKGRNKYGLSIISSLVVSGSVNIVTVPIVAGTYYEIATYSIVINLLVIPLMTLLLWIGLMAVLISFIWINAGRFLIGTSAYILKIYESLCDVNDRLPNNLLSVKKPSTEAVILYYLILIIILWMIHYCVSVNRFTSKRIIGVLSMCFLMLAIIIKKDTDASVIFMDVGQGDCALVNMGGSRILVDGGSSDIDNVGEYRIVPCIKSMGYNYIDMIIISHTDKDHISGIEEIIEKELLEVGQVILYDIEAYDDMVNEDNENKNEEKHKEYQEFINLLIRQDIKYSYISKGDAISCGNVQMKVLHPYKQYNGDKNQQSLVLHINYNELSILFTGDIGEQEELLIKNEIEKSNLMVDVLKVPHHGSKYSSCNEFLSKIKPRYSIISCGIDNSYGHPHKETINRLLGAGSNIYITSKGGAIIIYYDKIIKAAYWKD